MFIKSKCITPAVVGHFCIADFTSVLSSGFNKFMAVVVLVLGLALTALSVGEQFDKKFLPSKIIAILAAVACLCLGVQVFYWLFWSQETSDTNVAFGWFVKIFAALGTGFFAFLSFKGEGEGANSEAPAPGLEGV